MKYLSEFLEFFNKKKKIALQHGYCWRISPPKNFATFIKHLLILFKEDSILYLEGNNTPSEVSEFLNKRKANKIEDIAHGTFLPTPEYFHISLSNENLENFASLLETHFINEIPTHVLVYFKGKVLLQWYDASYEDPILISKVISEEKIKEFCEILNCSYEEIVY